MSEYKFDEGVMWEENPWMISTDYECSAYGGNPCKHCHPSTPKIHTRSDGSTFEEQMWICPCIVIAYNEAGYNSTGVCLDCILEAAEKVPKDNERKI